MNNKKMRNRIVVGERPADVPPGWIICNAPRPIFGDKLWLGDFITGRFYAAFDPQRAGADALYTLNCQNDATVIGYITEDAAIERGRAIILERYPASAEVAAIVNDPASKSWLISTAITAAEQSLLEFGIGQLRI